MNREFCEETGITLHEDSWTYFCQLKGKDSKSEFIVYFFMAYHDDVFNVQTKEIEKVKVFAVNELHLLSLVPNVKWLLPMALSLNEGEHAKLFSVFEHG